MSIRLCFCSRTTCRSGFQNGLVFPQPAEDVLLARSPAHQSDLDTAGNESNTDTEVAKVHRCHLPLRRAKPGHPTSGLATTNSYCMRTPHINSIPATGVSATHSYCTRRTNINNLPTTSVATAHSYCIFMYTCQCSPRDVVYVVCAVAYSTHKPLHKPHKQHPDH